jgi:hypothetical protein
VEECNIINLEYLNKHKDNTSLIYNTFIDVIQALALTRAEASVLIEQIFRNNLEKLPNEAIEQGSCYFCPDTIKEKCKLYSKEVK